MKDEDPLRVTLLGGFGLAVGARPVPRDAWRLTKGKDLVKMLALAPGRRLHREQVLESLWPEREREAQLNNLHQVVSAARNAIAAAGGDGHACVAFRAETLLLCPHGEPWIDADAFERSARAAIGGDDRALCRAALDLYAGELLPEDRYASWTSGPREILRGLAQEVRVALALCLEADGELALAADLLRGSVAEDPAHEAAHRHLMRVYARAGDRGAAARQFQTLTQALHDELAVAPDEHSVALHRDIASGRVGSVAGDSLVSPRRSNLPAPLSSFVGRASELERIPSLVRQKRLVTLVGPGGCGKTRLALEIGTHLMDAFEHGVFLVELAATAGAEDVMFETARALGVRSGADEASAVASVVRRIGHGATLLILDNCEHVVAAVAGMAAALLGQCPHLHVLATSREALRLPGETVRRVAPLSAPDPAQRPSLEAIAEHDAVRLFVERAADAHEGFALDTSNAPLVAAICYRLDGIPLALELAAARVAALPLSAIAGHLDDRFRFLTGGLPHGLTRQQTLEATVAWSYALLAPQEQTMFRRLAVFYGPFDLEAAAAVADPALQGSHATALLARLVERSMVVSGVGGSAAQFRLLDTMRAYGRERLAEQGELAEARSAHARWLFELAQRTAPLRAGAVGGERFAELDRAHDELLPALEHLIHHDGADALRLVVRLCPYCLWNDQVAEGLMFSRLVLEHVLEPSTLRVEAAIGASVLALRGVGFDLAARYAVGAAADARTLDDRASICRALLCLGIMRWCAEDLVGAERLFGEARAVAVQDGLVPEAIVALQTSAALCADWRNFDAAERHLEEAEGWCRRLREGEILPLMVTLGHWLPMRRGGASRLMWAEPFVVFRGVPKGAVRPTLLSERANLARLVGDRDRARAGLREALALFREEGDAAGVSRMQCRLGQVAFSEGDFDDAYEQLEESRRLRLRIGEVRSIQVNLVSLARLAAERQRLDLAHRYLRDAEEMSRDRLDRPGLSMILIERGVVALAAGEADDAVALLTEALTIARAHGTALHVGCVLRDLGAAQAAAGRGADAAGSLAEAVATFARVGHDEEAGFCRALRVSAGGR
ncbi:MAG: BTAD domain-containing putative transcriptional regulator [Trueperaceae bacterium]|nr:BTAD domain-containing putative transcriptional regulator [Trueperaceae bacterium]